MSNEIRFRLAIDGAQQVNQGLNSVGQTMAGVQQQAGASGARVADAFASIPNAARVSAAQTAAAWRMLPQQLQDVAVSLQGGMSPATVLMQQGPQIVGSFGGVRATLAAVAAAVSPVMVGVGALALGMGAAALAAHQGSAETRAFEAALIATNGRLGLTSDQLGTMARRMDGLAGVTRGQASEALAVMAAQAGISSRNIEQLTAVALRLQNAGGPAVAETAAQFSALAKDPLTASVKLNEATGYLTESVYKQIRALEARGQREQAAKVAQDAYAAAAAEQARAMEANMGTLEKAWKSLTTSAREAWDAMLNIGREDTLDQQIEKAAKKVAEAQALVSRGGRKGIFGEKIDSGEEDLLAAQAELYGLQAKKRADEAKAQAKATQAKAVQEQIDADGAVGDRLRAIAAAQAGVDLARAQAAADARVRVEDNKLAALEALRSAGLVGERSAAEQALQIERAKLAAQQQLVQRQIALEQARQLKADDVTGAKAREAKLIELQSKLADLGNRANQAQAAAGTKIAGLDLADARTLATQWAGAWQQAADKATTLADQTAQAQVALITNPTEAARQQAELTIAQMMREADKVKATYAALIAQLRAGGQAGAADALQAQAGRIDQGTQGQADALRGKVVADYLKDSTAGLSAGWDGVTQSIGGTVSALLRLVDTQESYEAAVKAAGGDQEQLARIEMQRAQQTSGAYAAVLGAAKGYFKEHTAGYKIMQGAERAFRAYQLVTAVANAAREMGLITAVTAAKVTGVAVQTGAVAAGQAGETAAVTAGESARNAAKLPGVFLAFMSALGPWGLAAAAVAIAAVWKGGGTHGSSADMTEQRQAENGTGTVLGDSKAKSESIANALDLLGDVDTMTMRYSAQMAASLQSIEASMAGVSVQILRAGGITTGSNLGIQTGLMGRNVGDPVLNALGLDDYTRNLPVIGGIVNTLQGLWGKTTVDIIDAGLTLRGTVAELMRGAGVSQYADARVTESSWFGLRKDQSTTTTTADVSDELTRQFGLIFSGVGASLKTAAEAMGQDAARVGQLLAGYVFDIPRLSLEGLTGDALQEAIASAVGAQADTLARTMIAGLDGFQRVGEGYYETVVRVASGSEQAQQALRGLGVTMTRLTDVANQQADDISAEMVRQSLVAAETTAVIATELRQVPAGLRAFIGGAREVPVTTITETVSGIGEILSTFDGSATELRDAYLALTNVRTAFGALGLSAAAVGRDLLAGAGSLDALTSGLSAYEDGFATDSEKLAVKSETMREAFSRLGLALPDSADGFRALVKGIDTSTAAGRELLGQVLTLSDGMRELLDAVQSTTGGIVEEIERIRGLTASGGTGTQSLASLQASFAIKAAQARAGDSAALADLPNASKALLDAAADLAGSRAELVRLQAGTAATLQGVVSAVNAAAVQTPAATAPATPAAPAAPATPSAAASDSTMQALLAELQALRRTTDAQAAQARERDAQIIELQQAVASATAATARTLDTVTSGGDEMLIRFGGA